MLMNTTLSDLKDEIKCFHERKHKDDLEHNHGQEEAIALVSTFKKLFKESAGTAA